MSESRIPWKLPTLESATRIASKLAMDYGYDHYVTETHVGRGSACRLECVPVAALDGGRPVTDNERIEGQAAGAAMLDGDQVVYGWCDEPSLARQLILAHFISDAPGAGLAILRVARPDGNVEAVTDPSTEAERLAAFCHMTDQERHARWEGHWS